MRVLFLVLSLALAAAGPARAAEPASPLEPLALASPRAALVALERLAAEVEEAYAAYEDAPSVAGQARLRATLARAPGLFDLAGVPATARRNLGERSFAALVDVLLRLPPIDPASLPDDPALSPDRLLLPGTEIEISRIGDAPGGSFVFSAATVERLPEFHDRIADAPVLRPVRFDDWVEEQTRFTGPLVPGFLAREMPETLERRLLGTPAWKIVATIAIYAGAAALAFVLVRALLAGAGERRPLAAAARRLAAFAGAAVLALLARGYVLGQIHVWGTFHQIAQGVGLAAAFAAAAFAAHALCLLAAEALVAAPFRRERVDDDLLRLGGRAFGLAAAIATTAWGADLLGIPVLGLIAGLGIGGVALALAAQSTLENLFGGVSLFADHPFRVGDEILFEGQEGTVESVGIRSTRIRGADGMLTSVPNSELARTRISNKTRRASTLFQHVLPIAHGADRRQLDAFQAGMLAAIAAFPLDPDADAPPRVRVVGLGAAGIEVEIHADLLATDEDDFFRMQEALLLAARDLLAAVGARIAVPGRIVRLARDDAAGAPIAPADQRG